MEMKTNSRLSRRGAESSNQSIIPIDPHSHFCIIWNLISIICLVYNAVVMPLRLCFSVYSWCPDPSWFVECFIDIFFMCDVALHFITAQFSSGGDSGTLERDLRKIAHRYLTSWFLVDFISSLPLDFIISIAYSPCVGVAPANDLGPFVSLRMVRVLRLAKILKWVRALRVNTVFDKLKDYMMIHNDAVQMLSLFAFTMYIAHMIASAWFAVGRIAASEGDLSWVERSGLVINETVTEDLGIAYLTALYWAMTTLSTVGWAKSHALLPLVFVAGME